MTNRHFLCNLPQYRGSGEPTRGCAKKARNRHGMHLHVYGVLELTATGEQIVPRSERAVFERLGVPYHPRRYLVALIQSEIFSISSVPSLSRAS